MPCNKRASQWLSFFGCSFTFVASASIRSRFTRNIYAGIKLIESSHARITPILTKIPKTCTGGIGTSANDAKPIAVVMEV